MDYGDFHPCLFQGAARFFKPSYKSNLLEKWIPMIPAATEKLENGGRLCDVGCGKGVSTLLLAGHYPKAIFVGMDIHKPSIDEANEEARQAGLSDRLRYDAADAESYGGEYDIITFFDCLHHLRPRPARKDYSMINETKVEAYKFWLFRTATGRILCFE